MKPQLPIERSITQAERYIESVDKERDDLARSIDGTELQTAVHTAFVKARLGFLEQDRADAVQLLGDLRARRYHKALMFPKRPMLKMPGRRLTRSKTA